MQHLQTENSRPLHGGRRRVWSPTMTRDEQITQLAAWYGVNPRLFRHFDQHVLDDAWLVGLARWN